jgi:hypothetical protein
MESEGTTAERRRSAQRRAWIVVGAATAGALAVYVATAAPGAWWGDGLELTAAAAVLGVPHPTGYPLYMMLGHVVIRIFGFVDPGRVMTLLSSAACAATVGLIGATLVARNRADGASGFARGELTTIAGVALVVAFSRTLWDHATYAEVYPLTAALAAAIVAVSLHIRRRNLTAANAAALGALCGLAMLNHYSILAMAPLAALTVLASPGRKIAGGLVFAGAFLICLLGYLYLPIRAGANPAINWGDARTWEGFLWVVKGGDYMQGRNLGEILGSKRLYMAAGWIDWWTRQGLPPWVYAEHRAPWEAPIGGTIAGCALIARRDGPFGVGLALSILATLAFAAMHPIPDIDGYFLPALPAAALGWWEILRRLGERWGAGRVGLATCALAAAMLIGGYREIDKSWDDGPKRWSEAVLEALPPNAMVLTRMGHDSEINALLCSQLARGLRPDVVVFGSGFTLKSWYARWFEWMGPAAPKLSLPDREPGEKAVYDLALHGGVIAPNLGERRIFTTYMDLDWGPGRKYEGIRLKPVKALMDIDYYARTAYQLNPPGRILFEVEVDPEFAADTARRFKEWFGVDPLSSLPPP